MPKVKFKFNKEKDLKNIWKTCNNPSKWYDFSKDVPKEIIRIAKNKNFNECKKEIESFQRQVYSRKELIEDTLKIVQKQWNNINEEFFKRLEKVFDKPICSEKFTGYLTTTERCPYEPEENSFMFSLYYSIPHILLTTAHEIMHIQFHKTYWPEVEEKIGEEKTDQLKEALTVLLNAEFNDLLTVKDPGYLCHKQLRQFIKENWEKEENFEKLLDKCAEYLKDS